VNTPVVPLKRTRGCSATVAVRKRANETAILLLENEENDVFFFRRALNALGYEGKLQVLPNIAEAHAYIEGTGQFGDRSRYPLPDLIVSDSNLDDGTGVEFFHWLHARSTSARIPFVLFTSAAPPAVGVALVNAGATAFITKSIIFDDTKKSVEDILEFLPSSNSAEKEKQPVPHER
jgi:CheY-like chemotaxis protein